MEHPNLFTFLSLAAFVPLTLAAFAVMEGRRAMLLTLLGGWLFLPWFNGFGEAVPLLHSKQMFVPAVVLAGSLLLDTQTWARLRPSLADLPIAVACTSPLFTSLASGMGTYDGLSALFEGWMKWAGPYLLARAYLGSPAGLAIAADAVVKAALVCVPLCLLEVRMSPQLHRLAYGYHQHFFSQHVRDGGYRPMLFMAHGLQVAMFMAAGTLLAVWLWRTRGQRQVAGLPMWLACLGLGLATLLTRSVGPLVLLAAGLLVLEGTRWLRWPVLVLALAAVPAVYATARMSGWTGTPLVELARSWTSGERAASLRIRLENEEALIERAMERRWLGRGRSDDFRVRDEEGHDVTISDGLWVVLLGTSGLVVLGAFGLFLALPALLLLRTFPARHWAHPRVAPAAAMAVALLIWAVDELFNAMLSPIFPLLAGTLVGLWRFVTERRARPAPARAGPPPRHAGQASLP